MTATRGIPPPRSIPQTVAGLVAALAMAAGALTACGSDEDDATGHAHGTHSHAAADIGEETALRLAMRGLWTQHMEWTYATVVAFAADSPALQATMTRLLRNQSDIGAAVAPYYGDDAGKQLSDLLSTHIKDAVPVLTAAKAGDNAGLTTAVDTWYANAQDIADFLAAANPSWEQADMRQMMKGHITQTIGYASDVLAGSYDSALAKYDEAEAHMIDMADMLTAGLVAQFPDKF